MTMKKKVLTTLSVVLILGLAALGILAYLTSTDSDVNVMTLGNVKIEQQEYERALNEDGSYKTAQIDDRTSYVLQDFTQAKPLLPATEIDADGNPVNNGAGGWDATTVRMSQVGSYGGMQVFTSKNAQDKFVTVENTGKSDAYVRTIVAIEVGSGKANLIGKSARVTTDETDAGEGTPWFENVLGKVEISGNNYIVYEYVYCGAKLSDGSYRHADGVLPAGDTTYPNLSQVYLKAEATNEDMEAIDGNDNGTLDILVLSQAVQTAGFDNAQTALDTAFGDVTAENAEAWFTGTSIPVAVATADELYAALNAGNSVYLTADINDNRMFVVKEDSDVIMYMNGHTLTSMDGGTGNNYAIKVSKNAHLTLKGDGKIVASCYGVTVAEDAEFTMNSGEIVVRGNGRYDYGVVVWNGGEFIMNGGKITASVDVYAAFYDGYTSKDQPTVVINDGELVKEKENKDEADPAYIMTDCSPIVKINGGTFDGVAFSGNVSDYLVVK